MNIDLDYLRKNFRYDENTGIFYRLLYAKCGNIRAVGHIKKHDGYVYVCVNRKKYAAHRLAILYVTGAPPDGEIDHINRIKTDNRICNLRVVSKSVNQQNKALPQKNNTTGVLGVDLWHGKKFRARIGVNGKQMLIGWYDSIEEAEIAYWQAKSVLHVGFSR